MRLNKVPGRHDPKVAPAHSVSGVPDTCSTLDESPPEPAWAADDLSDRQYDQKHGEDKFISLTPSRGIFPKSTWSPRNIRGRRP